MDEGVRVSEETVAQHDEDAPGGDPSTAGSGDTADTAEVEGLAPVTRDHVEMALDASDEPAPAAAGVSDRGHHRRRNEDSFALGRCRTADGRPAVMAVVADGVASVPDGDAASRAAGSAAVAAAAEALAENEEPAYAATLAAEAACRSRSARSPGSTDGRRPAPTWPRSWSTTSPSCRGSATAGRTGWPPTTRSCSPRTTRGPPRWSPRGWPTPTPRSDPRAHVITRWLAADATRVSARSVQVP